MSAAIEPRQTSGIVVLPPEGRMSIDEQANASMTRWAWNPYRVISNTGLTGGPPSPVRAIGYKGRHRYAQIERCVFYPLGNIDWEEVDREFLAEQSLGGISFNGPAPVKVITKYAFDQASELAESYGETYGLRVFQPGILPTNIRWVDDHDLVSRVVSVLQPQAFKIHEMDVEFTVKAVKRINDSELKGEERILAEEFRKIMLRGAMRARVEAEREYRELIGLMGNAAVGKNPSIATPNEFHVWLCDQLNMTLPETVHATAKKDSTLERAVTLLAERALTETNETEQLKTRLAESEARSSEFESRLETIEQRRKPGPKPKDE